MRSDRLCGTSGKGARHRIVQTCLSGQAPKEHPPQSDMHAHSTSALTTTRSALFLDRDGIINIDRGYVHSIEEFEFRPGIFELARFWAKELGGPIVVATNQSGIGRGYFDEASFAALTAWMCHRFFSEGAPITRVYHCPFHPEDGVGSYRADHSWRKPAPGMFLQAATDFDLELSRCVAVGDQMSDIEAATAAGIGLSILVQPNDLRARGALSYAHAADLCEALAIIRAHFSRTRAADGEPFA
jgi:D-glycero-D-manno-heptose 1,7-bisphosphate phosphatase